MQNSVMVLIKKEILIPVMKSCTQSLACFISSCFAKKRRLPKYGFFLLKVTA